MYLPFACQVVLQKETGRQTVIYIVKGKDYA